MYSEKDENELIDCAQKGDKQACSQLLAAYEGLMVHMSRRYQYTPTGKLLAEDARGILNLAFIEAIRDFDLHSHVHFAAFLQSRLHGAIYKAFRKTCSCQQHTTHPEAATTEEGSAWYDTIASTIPTPERTCIARAELTNICRQLSAAEKRLLSLIYLQGLTLKNIAQQLHLTPGAVSKQKAKLIAHLQAIADMDTACPCT